TNRGVRVPTGGTPRPSAPGPPFGPPQPPLTLGQLAGWVGSDRARPSILELENALGSPSVQHDTIGSRRQIEQAREQQDRKTLPASMPGGTSVMAREDPLVGDPDKEMSGRKRINLQSDPCRGPCAEERPALALIGAAV